MKKNVHILRCQESYLAVYNAINGSTTLGAQKLQVIGLLVQQKRIIADATTVLASILYPCQALFSRSLILTEFLENEELSELVRNIYLQILKLVKILDSLRSEYRGTQGYDDNE